MPQYNTLNVTFFDSQLNKLKSGIKYGAKVILVTFPRKLLLINTQVSRLCQAFANKSSANIKLSKTQLSKIGH